MILNFFFILYQPNLFSADDTFPIDEKEIKINESLNTVSRKTGSQRSVLSNKAEHKSKFNKRQLSD